MIAIVKPMIRKKMAMVGASGVGKTSLVSRFVFGIFPQRYQKTIGVSIDKREVEVDGREATLMLWDLQGEDDRAAVRMDYVKGSAGFFLVADGTRARTLDVAERMRDEVLAVTGDVPFALLVNKSDLQAGWEVPAARLDALRAAGWDVVETSAKAGDGVEEAFDRLAGRMLRQQ